MNPYKRQSKALFPFSAIAIHKISILTPLFQGTTIYTSTHILTHIPIGRTASNFNFISTLSDLPLPVYIVCDRLSSHPNQNALFLILPTLILVYFPMALPITIGCFPTDPISPIFFSIISSAFPPFFVDFLEHIRPLLE